MFPPQLWKIKIVSPFPELQRLHVFLFRFDEKRLVVSQNSLHSRFHAIKKGKVEKEVKDKILPEVVCRTQKIKPDSCSGGQGHPINMLFYFILIHFEENSKWRPDGVIPETVNINRSASNAIPDIPLQFNTSDINFAKIL